MSNSLNQFNYLKNAVPAIVTAIGVSALSSAYSYATWDRYNLDQRAEMMRQETGVYAYHDESIPDDMDSYLHEQGGVLSTEVKYKKEALYSRAVARVNYAHEMQHLSDFNSFLEDSFDTPKQVFENRAYGISQSMASSRFVPIRYQLGWAAQNTSIPGYAVPANITPFNILASLFR